MFDKSPRSISYITYLVFKYIIYYHILRNSTQRTTPGFANSWAFTSIEQVWASATTPLNVEQRSAAGTKLNGKFTLSSTKFPTQLSKFPYRWHKNQEIFQRQGCEILGNFASNIPRKNRKTVRNNLRDLLKMSIRFSPIFPLTLCLYSASLITWLSKCC